MIININPIYNYILDDNKRLNITQTPFEEFITDQYIENEVSKEHFLEFILPDLKKYLSNESISNENELIISLNKFFRETEITKIINLPIKYDDMYILFTYKNENGNISTSLENYTQNSICQTYKYMMNVRCSMFELGLGIWDQVNTKLYTEKQPVRYSKTEEIRKYLDQFGRLPLNTIHIFVEILEYDKPLVKDIIFVDEEFLKGRIFLTEKELMEYDSPIALMYYNKFKFEDLKADPNAEILSIEIDQPLFIGTKSKVKIKASGRLIDIGIPDKELYIWSNVDGLKSKAFTQCNICEDIIKVVHYNLENSIPLVTFEVKDSKKSNIDMIINGECF